jgi:hypothetical protein
MRLPFPQSKHIQICTVTLPPPASPRSFSFFHRVHTEWQWPISKVHSIMMENQPWLVRVGGGGGCTPTTFHSIYHHVQRCSVISSWEGRYSPPISSLPLYVLRGFLLWQTHRNGLQ